MSRESVDATAYKNSDAGTSTWKAQEEAERIECGIPYSPFEDPAVAQDAPEGEPVRRPPLFREEDGCLMRAGKCVLYVVLSPFIALYLIIDHAHLLGRGLRWLAVRVGACMQVVVDVIGTVGNWIAGVIEGAVVFVYERIMKPICSTISAALHAVYRILLRPIGRGLLYVIRKLQDVVHCCADVFFRFVLMPLYEGAAFLLRQISWAILHVARGVEFVAVQFHGCIIVPLVHGVWCMASCVWKGVSFVVMYTWFGIRFVVVQLHGWVIIPVYHAIASVLSAFWRGVCCVASALWHGAVVVAQAVYDFALMPLYHGMVQLCRTVGSVITAILHGVRIIANGIYDYALLPIYHSVVFVCEGIFQHIIRPAGQAAFAIIAIVYQTIIAAFSAIYSNLLHPAASAIASASKAIISAIGNVVYAIGNAAAGAASALAAAAEAIANFVKGFARRQ
mmetsp:Transcript_24811/g.59910  ORF Transcript_24811/g.59910 Transcript_24811/m.59910 type:complete len:449 (+) Transcript_24811:79-1425(+)